MRSLILTFHALFPDVANVSCKNEKNKSYLQTAKWHMTTHSADKQVYYVSITYSIHKVILR